MIFWRQSLFRFSRHLPHDMLIFLTICANYIPARLSRRRLRETARGRGGPPYN